jgi:hypothetical protein
MGWRQASPGSPASDIRCCNFGSKCKSNNTRNSSTKGSYNIESKFNRHCTSKSKWTFKDKGNFNGQHDSNSKSNKKMNKVIVKKDDLSHDMASVSRTNSKPISKIRLPGDDRMTGPNLRSTGDDPPEIAKR